MGAPHRQFEPVKPSESRFVGSDSGKDRAASVGTTVGQGAFGVIEHGSRLIFKRTPFYAP